MSTPGVSVYTEFFIGGAGTKATSSSVVEVHCSATGEGLGGFRSRVRPISTPPWWRPGGSPYGLAGTVWSADAQRATDIARRIDTGVVGISSWDLNIGSPFGGRRQSGLGHELGPEGIDSYLRFKTMFVGHEG